MEQPLVTCIMPTANRQEFIKLAINNFINQDYPNKELVIVDDGTTSCLDLIPDLPTIRYFYMEPIGTIGRKRNIACEKAKGEFILHWDDDDWYAPDWISRQVDALLSSGADICGLDKAIFFSLHQSYVYQGYEEMWFCGATLAYKKSLWAQYHFANLPIGEDADFLSNSGGKIFILDYLEGFRARVHLDNLSIKYVENMNTMGWHEQVVYGLYRALEKPLVTCIMPTANRQEFIAAAIESFIQQDYPNKELVIIDDGIESCYDLIPAIPSISYFYTEPLGTIGVKRNAACEKANGEIILHWDDDDWYAPDWITRQVNALLTTGVDITGLDKIRYYFLDQNFTYVGTAGMWLCGATLAYKKSLWKQYRFVNLQVGEDADFLLNSGGKIYALGYIDGFRAHIHDKNTSVRFLANTGTFLNRN